MTNEEEFQCVADSLLGIQFKDAPRDLVELVIKNWRAARAHRLEQERVAKITEKLESTFKSWLIEVFREQELEGMIIDGRSTGLDTKSVAVVADKEALCKHILETGELDLLQFRLQTSAVDERTEDGVEVPGTEYIDVYQLFDRKA